MLNVEYIKKDSVVWVEETETNKLNCIVKFEEFESEIPFCAARDDIYDHSEVILDMVIENKSSYGKIVSYVEYKKILDDEEQLQREIIFDDLKSQILELNPSAKISDTSLVSDMTNYLKLLQEQNLRSKFE